MNISFRQQLNSAMSLSGLGDWRSPVDAPDLKRPESRPQDLPGDGNIAAVLILFCDRESADEPDLLLTQRAITLSNHPGQISFPGGRLEPGESLRQAALRETEEEVGILESEIEIVGQLTSVYIPPSDFLVTPFVGCLQGVPEFRRCHREVEQIILTPIHHLMNPATLTNGIVTRSNGESLRVPCYRVGDHQVWGATALMIGELIERLSRVSG
ncbi:MAG: CoA pyrophosphatase [Mariniblastus sp.]|nr:CoA pyrophosphatase [Mariniblastus sp.]